MTYDVVVIGGGPAGVTAALRARELGASVALIERDRMGGTCTNDGCVPTRVLAKAARLLRDTEQHRDYGLIGEPPDFDFGRLIARTQHIVYRVHEKKQLLRILEEAAVDTFIGRGSARFVDAHAVELEDGTRIDGAKFILCVGGHARRLNFPGAEHTLTHSDVWQLKELPRSIAIVGAAATGCQLASVLAAFGATVYLLELAPRILPGEDEDVSRAMRDSFERSGVEVMTSINGVESVEKRGDITTLHYRAAGVAQTLGVDAVILCVGWPGNIDSLNLDAAGVKHERSYVEVDNYLRTSVDHIFAAGDITGRMMLVQSASYEARIAAENAVLAPNQYHLHHVVPHGGFTDPEYGSVGLTEAQARELDEEIAVATVRYAELDRAVIDGRTEGFCKLIVSKSSHRLLGAHVVGEQALEIVQIVAAGMASDMWLEQLAELEIAYPTFTAILGIAARRLMHDVGLTAVTTQWRSLQHGLGPAEWERSEL